MCALAAPAPSPQRPSASCGDGPPRFSAAKSALRSVEPLDARTFDTTASTRGRRGPSSSSSRSNTCNSDSAPAPVLCVERGQRLLSAPERVLICHGRRVRRFGRPLLNVPRTHLRAAPLDLPFERDPRWVVPQKEPLQGRLSVGCHAALSMRKPLGARWWARRWAGQAGGRSRSRCRSCLERRASNQRSKATPWPPPAAPGVCFPHIHLLESKVEPIVRGKKRCTRAAADRGGAGGARTRPRTTTDDEAFLVPAALIGYRTQQPFRRPRTLRGQIGSVPIDPGVCRGLAWTRLKAQAQTPA